jgi:hypothetical protein
VVRADQCRPAGAEHCIWMMSCTEMERHAWLSEHCVATCLVKDQERHHWPPIMDHWKMSYGQWTLGRCNMDDVILSFPRDGVTLHDSQTRASWCHMPCA